MCPWFCLTNEPRIRILEDSSHCWFVDREFAKHSYSVICDTSYKLVCKTCFMLLDFDGFVDVYVTSYSNGGSRF